MFEDNEGLFGEMPTRILEGRFEGTDGNAAERVETEASMMSLGGVMDRTDLQIQRDTILVVEDDVSIRNLVRLFLSNLLPEFKVVMAEDPVFAIDLLRGGLSGQVALIWTDNSMPNMKGRDFTQVLKGLTVEGHNLPPQTLKDLRGIPVVMVTGDETKETAGLLETGAITDVVRKPFNLASVREVVVPMARGLQAMA